MGPKIRLTTKDDDYIPLFMVFFFTIPGGG